MHIEHDWLHYRDFCENGLISIWNEAGEENDKNFILVLEDLNITQPECGLTPLLDVINGYRPVLEGTSLGLPENLKIFATVIPRNEVRNEENIGLKLSKELFSPKWKQFGNYNKSQYKCLVKSILYNSPYGYFEPDDLFLLYNDDCNLGEPFFDEQ